MTGTLDGKGGTNTIDYSKADPARLRSNLASNSSTGVGVAAFANIQSIIGTGAAGDTLIGPNATKYVVPDGGKRVLHWPQLQLFRQSDRGKPERPV